MIFKTCVPINVWSCQWGDKQHSQAFDLHRGAGNPIVVSGMFIKGFPICKLYFTDMIVSGILYTFIPGVRCFLFYSISDNKSY
jgi:hypothetical protein